MSRTNSNVIERGRYVTAAFAALLCAVMVSNSSAAADLPARAGMTQRFKVDGLGRAEVNLLRRQGGPGAAEVAAHVRAAFATETGLETAGGYREQSDRTGGVRQIGDGGWTLVVRDAGNTVSLRRRGDLFGPGSRRGAIADRPSGVELEQLGREFIEHKLGAFVTLGAGEALVPMKSTHEMFDAQDEAGQVTDEVVSSTVVFGRSVDGVLIVGAGSKVAVTISPDRVPVAFYYDWPQYKAVGTRQRVLDAAATTDRMKALMKARTGRDGNDVQRLECGLYDAGGGRKRRDTTAVVQAGCFTQYMSAGGAFADAIPIGVSVERDTSWPQARILRQE